MKPMTNRFLLLALLGIFTGCRQTSDPATVRSDFAPSKSEVESVATTCAILSWNVESGGADPTVIKRRLDEHVRQAEVSIVVLQEVSQSSFDILQIEGWDSIRSKSGRADRLMIQFDTNRYELLAQREPTVLSDINVNPGNHRSPQMALLKSRHTDLTFWLINVHQARGDENLRNQQAIALREWARSEPCPIVLIGDLNMDYDFHTQRGNTSFSELVRDNVFVWVKPDPLIDTNWADRNGDGKDDFPDSIIDGAFVANGATTWNVTSRVIVVDGDFPDDNLTSDHRPIILEW